LKEDKLSVSEYVNLAIEGGIGEIPYVGGVVQNLYFGAKNEKRFKRIENFYRELNQDLEQIKDSIPQDILTYDDKDQLIGILEGINDEIEKARAQQKINLYKNLYKNCILKINDDSWNNEEYFLSVLDKLTIIEVQLIAYFMEHQNDALGNVTMDGISQELVEGSLSHLSDYGLLEKNLISIQLGGNSGRQNIQYRISNLGKEFVLTTMA